MTSHRVPVSSAGLTETYLRSLGDRKPHLAALAFYASLEQLASSSPVVARSILRELRDQRQNVKLIASENYSTLTTQLAHGNWLTDKYAEGYPGHRFYAGCENVDAIESEAVDLARSLFAAEHAHVQAHSGADANLIAFLAILATRVLTPRYLELGIEDPVKADLATWRKVRSTFTEQRILALDFYSGGHLTHGYRHNISGLLFEGHTYSVNPQTKRIDIDEIHRKLRELRPLILLAGYSAYPRLIDFAQLRTMADDVGAVLMVDMAHFAGLVAGKVFTGDFDPVPHAHIVTSTTHKTLRGPRGGVVLCQQEFADAVDRACPLVMGGPLPHAMAAKAVAFREASSAEFRSYAASIVENARHLAAQCLERGIDVLTGGTDNHLVLLDVAASYGLTGRQAESALRSCGLTLNRNALPFDSHGPWYTSGLRLGTAAVTTLGMGAPEMREIADIIHVVLSSTTALTVEQGPRAGQKSPAKFALDPSVAEGATRRVRVLLEDYQVYPELDAALLETFEEGLQP